MKSKSMASSNFTTSFLLLIIFSMLSSKSFAQNTERNFDKDSVISAAREIIKQQTYCALITVDSLGNPQVRTMNPFPPDENMVVWIATNSRSRKVQEIKSNPNVSLYYADHSKATGYVAISGKAELVDDMEEKLKRKREYWNQAFPDWKYLILIKVVPEKLDIVNYKWGMYGSSDTWKSPSIEF